MLYMKSSTPGATCGTPGLVNKRETELVLTFETELVLNLS